MRQHRIRNMGVLINRDGGDYGSDVVTPTVEEEEENNSQADTQVIQNQHELTERRFPFFVPSNSAWSKKPKRSWKPLSGSSRHILLQYARRAKSSILATVPEPRRDDVIHLIDRIIKSSTRKLDERFFPKPLFSGDASDLASISSTFDNQQKQNALLLRNAQTIKRERELEKDKELALKAEITALKNQLALEQATVQKLREDYPVFHATRVERNQEQVIRDTRQGNTSFWRQPLLKRMNDDSPWWKELEPAIVERFAKERPLRGLIKRLSTLDELLSHY
ncbi:hypothetical protein WA171_004666, partial [Blastocystis sp. BT1]